MKIRWVKEAAGIYRSDSGRWLAVQQPSLKWHVFDAEQSALIHGYRFEGRTLAHAKRLVDECIESELREEFAPEVEAGIESITEQIITEMGLPSDDPVLEAIISRAYSEGWENGYEVRCTQESEAK
jgi:hypothetical protein